MRLTYKGWQVHFGITHSQEMVGVNNRLSDGKYFLMWDFDTAPLKELTLALTVLQDMYKLPNIYILSTGTPNHYHAYCFARMDFKHLVFILLDTPFLDTGFLRIGFLRGYYTLRISDKNGKFISPVAILQSKVSSNVTQDEVSEVIRYWTRRV